MEAGSSSSSSSYDANKEERSQRLTSEQTLEAQRALHAMSQLNETQMELVLTKLTRSLDVSMTTTANLTKQHLHALRKQNDAAVAKIEELAQECARLKDAVRESQRRRDAAAHVLAAVQDQADQAVKAIESGQAIQTVKGVKAVRVHSIDLEKQAADAGQRQVIEAVRRAEEATEHLAQVQQIRDRVAASTEVAERQLQGLRQERKRAVEEQGHLTTKLRGITSRCNDLEHRAEKAITRENELREQMTSRENELREQMTSRENELREQMTSRENELREQMTSRENELRAMRSRCDDIEDANRRAEERAKKLIFRENELRAQLEALELREKDVESRLSASLVNAETMRRSLARANEDAMDHRRDMEHARAYCRRAARTILASPILA